jgi:crotonobetainyl-CoA:carnitine CoA-transferase CaiB-like acyl-CoA transferase
MVNIGSPLELSDTPTQPSVRAPSLGEHTIEVLREAGYDDAAIEELRAEGAIE